jgi:solute carrier family 25 folate transporter 32
MENRVSQPNLFTQGFYSFLSANRSLSIDWLSGLAAGFTTATVCAPLDVARTRHMLMATTKSHKVINYKGFLHTMSKVYRDEGLRGMYKGYSVTAVSVPVFHSLYFALFYKTKEYLDQRQIFGNSKILQDITAACSSGFICNTITNPLWIIRTRMQSQFLHQETIPKYKGIFSGLTRVCKEEGVKALFKGLGASYVGLSHAAILYPLYEYLKTNTKNWKGSSLNSMDIFSLSLLSKFTAMVITYPHTVLRVRLQDHRAPAFMNREKQGNTLVNVAKKNKATITSVIQETLRREGIKGFYAGLRIDLVRVLPANSVMFVMFELVRKELENQLTDY